MQCNKRPIISTCLSAFVWKCLCGISLSLQRSYFPISVHISMKGKSKQKGSDMSIGITVWVHSYQAVIPGRTCCGDYVLQTTALHFSLRLRRTCELLECSSRAHLMMPVLLESWQKKSTTKTSVMEKLLEMTCQFSCAFAQFQLVHLSGSA